VEESDHERLNRQLLELLNELRVALPGVQILFAFLLAVPFYSRFAHVDQFQRDVYFATLICAAVASAFLIAPAIYHRMLFGQHHKRAVIITGHRCLVLGTAALALAMTGVILLISDLLFSRAAAIAWSGASAAMFIYLWFVMALLRRRKDPSKEPMPGEDPWPP
jgi:hypothetical protein